MFTIIGIAVAAVAVLGVPTALVVGSIRRSNDTTLAVRPKAGALALSPEQNARIQNANHILLQAKLATENVRDSQIRKASRDALAKAEKVIATLKKQPQEIRRSTQFFNYYLPTLLEVLTKFTALEEGNLVTEEIREATRGHVADMAHAFDLQYENMFKDEVLDLTVEIEAMQNALKRDGLA